MTHNMLTHELDTSGLIYCRAPTRYNANTYVTAKLCNTLYPARESSMARWAEGAREAPSLARSSLAMMQEPTDRASSAASRDRRK